MYYMCTTLEIQGFIAKQDVHQEEIKTARYHAYFFLHINACLDQYFGDNNIFSLLTICCFVLTVTPCARELMLNFQSQCYPTVIIK